MSDLKPCPFCGSDAELVDLRTTWRVECTSPECGALVLGERAQEPTGREPAGHWTRFERTAIDRWNRRQGADG